MEPTAVVITCFSDRRWEQLAAAIESARTQDPPPQELVVVVDHNQALLGRIRRAWADVTVLANAAAPGASGARNTGAAAATSEVVAFLDDDARAAPGWLSALTAPFANPAVLGTGGSVRPAWSSTRPAWFPTEFDWVVGASYRGMPEAPARVRNVWAENMAVRRAAFASCGGFREGFGKLADRSRPEDTDLCIRMSAAARQDGHGGQWWYVPTAVVDHQVPAWRATVRFFLRRCYAEGVGKAELATMVGAHDGLSAERDYLRTVVPGAIVGGLRRPFAPGGGTRALRSLASAAAVGAAGAGFLRERSLGRGR